MPETLPAAWFPAEPTALYFFCSDEHQLRFAQVSSDGDPQTGTTKLRMAFCAHCAWCGVKIYSGEPECVWHETCPEVHWESTWRAGRFFTEWLRFTGRAPTEGELAHVQSIAARGGESVSVLVHSTLQWLRRAQET